MEITIKTKKKKKEEKKSKKRNFDMDFSKDLDSFDKEIRASHENVD